MLLVYPVTKGIHFAPLSPAYKSSIYGARSPSSPIGSTATRPCASTILT